MLIEKKKKRADRVLPLIIAQVYEEINTKVLIDKIIPNSLAAIRYRRGIPINIILCNSIAREKESMILTKKLF